MNTSMIIPVYAVNEDLARLTARCVSSMSHEFPDELFIIDDASPVKLPMDNVVRRSSNGGFAAAVNTGLSLAEGEILIICNNDILFIQPEWLSHLTKPLDRYDICSIRTTDSDGWVTEDKITFGDKFGSIWAMKRKVYDTIGGLDEGFGKGYFEDLDYHQRAKEAGFKIVKNHAGLVEHIGKATFSEVDPNDTSYQEAMMKFKKKHGAVW